MSTTTIATEYLPNLFGWEYRAPIVEECELVGRSVDYAAPGFPFLGDSDVVIETPDNPEAQEHLARAFEAFGISGPAHVLPSSIYLEEK